MRKRVGIALVGVLVLVLPLVGIKASQIVAMIEAGKSFVPPPQSVSAAEAQAESWRSRLTAIGTVTAVRGVQISTEIPGIVRTIAFESGQRVKTGEVLVRLDTAVERAQLQAAEAAASLAQVNFERAKKLRARDATSQAAFQTAEANARQARAQVAQAVAVIERKTLRAPFAGRLGLREVDPGQFLSAGTSVVQLVAMSPVYVDFLLPQQRLAVLEEGLDIEVRSDAFPGAIFAGKLESIDARVEESTRNVRLRAILDNTDEKLRAGMFVEVRVLLPDVQQVTVVPSTAVLYAPYGNSMFVVESPEEGGGTVANQRFVRLGERRGDFVVVTSGVEPGETVVNSGAFKLRNGMPVAVQAGKGPDAQIEPNPANR